MTAPADLIESEGTIVNRECHNRPVLFLDCDGVLAPGNGQPIDRDAVGLVTSFVRLADAYIVLCSDRVRFSGFVGDLVTSGLPAYRLRGQCDPATRPISGASSKVKRVLDWIRIAEEHEVSPSRWCVVDDCRSFAGHWATATVTVRPSGDVVSRVEMGLAWTYLTGKLPHSIRRELA